jgi:hypothetical protein
LWSFTIIKHFQLLERVGWQSLCRYTITHALPVVDDWHFCVRIDAADLVLTVKIIAFKIKINVQVFHQIILQFLLSFHWLDLFLILYTLTKIRLLVQEVLIQQMHVEEITMRVVIIVF